jgi:iron-sulfur cluster assembly protein
MFLLGTRLDFEADTLQASFTFQNSNQTGACGCGESVSIAPAGGAPGKAV